VYHATHGARFRVYIIDEVHMLTVEAFNAFLKILEEPPPHVKFALCTTDPQRMPETVRSRCQRLDFRRVSVPDVVSRLRQIADREGLTVDDDALRHVAAHAQGGLRDAEVLLEQLSVFAQGSITAAHVRALTGAVDPSRLAELLDAVWAGRLADMLVAADQILESGTDPGEFMDALLEHLRAALTVQVCGADSALVRAQGIDAAAAGRTAGAFTQEQMLYASAIVQAARKDARTSMMPRTVLELALVRLGRIGDLVHLEDLAAHLGAAPDSTLAPSPAPAAESAGNDAPMRDSRNSGTDAPPAPAPPAPSAPHSVGDADGSVREAPVAPVGPPLEGVLTLEDVRARWQSVLDAVTAKSMPVGAFLREGSVTAAKDDTISLGFTARHSFHRESLSSPERLRLVEETLAEVYGRPVRLSLLARREGSARTMARPTVERADEIAYKSPGIRKLVEKSGGRIVDIGEEEPSGA
jgi:DNA polymerase-3 subunit gamma/tau